MHFFLLVWNRLLDVQPNKISIVIYGYNSSTLNKNSIMAVQLFMLLQLHDRFVNHYCKPENNYNPECQQQFNWKEGHFKWMVLKMGKGHHDLYQVLR